MSLRFHNTLTNKVEEFAPLDGHTVRMYTCGPTVWSYAHIGNFRTFAFQDILRRWLRYRGLRLDHVMNLTDVDDRIIKESIAAGKSIGEYTQAGTMPCSASTCPGCSACHAPILRFSSNGAPALRFLARIHT